MVKLKALAVDYLTVNGKGEMIYMINLSGEYVSVTRRLEVATHYWSLVSVDGQFYHFDCSPHFGFTCFLQTDEQTRLWREKMGENPDYFKPDEEDVPERATVPIYDGNVGKN